MASGSAEGYEAGYTGVNGPQAAECPGFGPPPEFQCRTPSPCDEMHARQVSGDSQKSGGSQSQGRQASNGGQQPPMAAPMAVPMAAMIAPPQQEFCIKLSMASIEGRPLSVSLSRYDDHDNPLIGVSKGFLDLSGLNLQNVLGKNCRFLNQGLSMDLREKLRHAIQSGTPFMGVLKNMRHTGHGVFERFENLLHLVMIMAGSRRYILGLQADVTGLDLDLADGSLEAQRLQKMFDSVLSASVDSWIHFQEGMFFTAPLYLYIRCGGYCGFGDEVEIREEESCVQAPQLAAPDQCMVLAPRFPQPVPNQSSKARFLLVDDLDAAKESRPGGAPPRLNLSQALPVNAGAGQESRPPGQNDAHWTSTMKNQLRALNMEDPACVLSVRGISRLGDSSANKIRAHFSQFGHVKAVHVPLVFKKRSKEPRSAGKCFVVMDSTSTVERIVQSGTQQGIEGTDVIVSIEPFTAAANGPY